MSFEIIKNKLTILLYGLDGGEKIEKKFYDNPDNINLKQDDIDYMLFDSFSDFIDNISHKLNNIYEEESDEEEEGEDDEEEEEDDEEDGEEDDEEETDIDNILWFLDIYILLKDKLWCNWIKEISDTNKQIWDSLKHLKEENKLLKEENIRIKNQNKIKEEHIALQYHKEYNRQKRDIELKRDIMIKENEMRLSKPNKKKTYQRKNTKYSASSRGNITTSIGGGLFGGGGSNCTHIGGGGFGGGGGCTRIGGGGFCG